MHQALTVADFLERAAGVFPHRTAVVDEPGVAGSMGRATYGEVAARARFMGARLDDLGVPTGGRVAIVSPNSGRFLVSFFGVSAWGRVLVPVNYRLQPDEIAYIVEHSGAEVLLYDPDQEEAVSGIEVPHRFRLDGDDDAALFGGPELASPDRLPASTAVQTDPAGPDEPDPGAPVGDHAGPSDRAPAAWAADEDATCSINYTSGTTARPKGVQLTHRNCWLNAATFGWHVGVGDRDVYLHTLPMFHCNGWGMPYATTGMGCKQVIQRKIDGESILARVATEGVTLMCAAPAVLAAITDAAAVRLSRGEQIPGRDRVRVVVAGAPPPSRIIERVEGELGWELIQIYGLTETSPLLTVNRAPAEWDGLPPAERARRLSRAGTPAIGIRIRIDSAGEVLARGNHVFAGYWNQPEETATALAGGWFHTGDGGHLVTARPEAESAAAGSAPGDSAGTTGGSSVHGSGVDGNSAAAAEAGTDTGFLVISDRKKDVIITGGENVSSIEVEDCLYRHPAVAEAAVIGVPDDRWGETVKAIVVLRDGMSANEAELIEHCRGLLAHFKCPTSVELRDSLPRTATGKLQKFRLRSTFWEGRERQVN